MKSCFQIFDNSVNFLHHSVQLSIYCIHFLHHIVDFIVESPFLSWNSLPRKIEILFGISLLQHDGVPEKKRETKTLQV